MRTYTIKTALTLGLALSYLLGCSQNTSAPISADPPPLIDGHAGHDHDGHDHSDHGHEGHGHEGHHHDHSHAALGPNGGHLLELGNEKFHAEWTHDDESGKLTVFILDSAAKELVPIAADKLTLHKTVGSRTDKYELIAVDRSGEQPKSARFEITDKALLAALQMVGDGVDASLDVDVNGQPFTAKFSKHEDHHGHKH